MSYEVPLIFYHPDRRLVTISLVVEGGAKAVAGVMGHLAVRGVKVLGIVSWIPPVDENLMGLNVIADITELQEDLDEIVIEMSSAPEVKGLNVYESELAGLATCVKGGFASFLGERLFIMPHELFRALYNTFYSALGGSAFVIMRHAGRRVGEFARALSALVGDAVEMVKLLNEISSVLGLAREIRVTAQEGDMLRITVRDLADCVSISEVKPNTRTGHFFLGVLEELFRDTDGAKYHVEEVECVNTGGVACVFEIRRSIV
ncbi:MAG: hypothetical protein RMJ75_00785 [Nitrososphaerota archaeon]|nr:hypothetical protein [Nitrososphaerota archaeon]